MKQAYVLLCVPPFDEKKAYDKLIEMQVATKITRAPGYWTFIVHIKGENSADLDNCIANVCSVPGVIDTTRTKF